MATFRIAFDVGDQSGTRWETVDALVDSGSTYTWIPEDVLARLGVGVVEVLDFEIASGAVIQREVGETRVRVGGRTRTTLVVFGDEGGMPLLGAVTLETFSLAADPVNRRLVPVRALAMSSGAPLAQSTR